MAAKENQATIPKDAPSGRLTRSRAAAYRSKGASYPSLPPLPKPAHKQTNGKAKRPAVDSISCTVQAVPPQQKKRAVLRDVTNICGPSSLKPCVTAATKLKPKQSQKFKLTSCKNKQSTINIAKSVHVDSRNPSANDSNREKPQEEFGFPLLEEAAVPSVAGEPSLNVSADMDTAETLEIIGGTIVGDQSLHCNSKHGYLVGLGIVDIDNDKGNPQMCATYASEIYTNLSVLELNKRPSSDFMETIQKDVTQNMRGILIDWLVEVSEEYNLVPDTLYLTVYLIDRYLSGNYIERNRLQLLGITCMFIASKYEEIMAPRVDEFCTITDNTYSKEEVLKMESEVVLFMGYHLSVPTAKTFLRRFLRASQASHKAPSSALGFMANYLAELTLIEYNFLKYLPSVVASSAIFLARWTLDQSDNPWNQTLEHYTHYKSCDLKDAVVALRELQHNSQHCTLNAIREKYRKPKFESVSTLRSPELPPSLFS